MDKVHAFDRKHPVPPAELPRFHFAVGEGNNHGDGIVGDGNHRDWGLGTFEPDCLLETFSTSLRDDSLRGLY